MTTGKIRCTRKTKSGADCQAWAMKGSDPPTCSAHAGLTGAPPGNRNRESHGFYSKDEVLPASTIDEVIERLLIKHNQVELYIDRLQDEGELTAKDLVALFPLYAQTASRIGRLMRDKRVVDSGGIADELLARLDSAIDAVGNRELFLGNV